MMRSEAKTVILASLGVVLLGAASPSASPQHLPGGDRVRPVERGPVALPPREVCAGADCPDYSVERFDLTAFDGRQASLKVFSKKMGPGSNRVVGQINARVQNNWVRVVEQRFSANGSASGFETSLSVEVPRGAVELSVVLSPDGRERSYDNNSRVVSLQFSDLEFSAGATIEQIAGGDPNRRLHLEVANRGPLDLAGGRCRVLVHFLGDGQNVDPRPVEFAIPGLPARARYQRAIPFSHPPKNAFRATIECPAGVDAITGNNSQTANVR